MNDAMTDIKTQVDAIEARLQPIVYERIHAYCKARGLPLTEMSERMGRNKKYLDKVVRLMGIGHEGMKYVDSYIPLGKEALSLSRRRADLVFKLRGLKIAHAKRLRDELGDGPLQPWPETVAKHKVNPHISARAWG